MINHKTIAIALFLSISSACVTAPNNSVNSNSASAVPIENSSVDNDNSASVAKPSVNQDNSKLFLGNLGDNRIKINLTREGNDFSGNYQYEKIGKDLKLSGTIDQTGKFTLQETDQSGNKTGEWQGVWKETDGRVTLNGKWKNPKGGESLDFSADEQKLDFTGGAKLTTKTANESNKAKFYKITAEYPEISGVDAKTAANFNQNVKKIVDAANDEFKKELPDITTPEDLQRYKENGISLYDELSYEVALANDDSISILFKDENFMGGAHGSFTTKTLNFDLKNNRVLKLSDLFEPNSDYTKMLSEISLADLKAQLKKDDILDNEMLNEGAGAKEKNFESWNLTKKGLKINFDPYQVAAYAAGPREVVVPYSKLGKILRPEYSR